MKMKQIVIEIPEEIHLCIIKDGYFFDNETNIIRQAIKNGTPLPEGHGDLIDVDKLLASERPNGIADDVWKESHIYKLLSSATPVIKADTEENEEAIRIRNATEVLKQASVNLDKIRAEIEELKKEYSCDDNDMFICRVDLEYEHIANALRVINKYKTESRQTDKTKKERKKDYERN